MPTGWLFDNEDTGREFSESHPVRSGEVPDAKNVVPATRDNLLSELLASWKGSADDRQEISRLREEAADNPYRYALRNIINWADLALKNAQEFDSHGVQLLNGPFFDEARELLGRKG